MDLFFFSFISNQVFSRNVLYTCRILCLSMVVGLSGSSRRIAKVRVMFGMARDKELQNETLTVSVSDLINIYVIRLRKTEM